VIVGVNLLREGLDLPEVSLVAILDADKEGFLRSRTSLVQTMGRAARHETGEVILYADRETDSIKYALSEVTRRRKVQLAYNEKHGITPKGIQKPIRERLVEREPEEVKERESVSHLLGLDATEIEAMTPADRKKVIQKLTAAMRQAGRDLDFEFAAKVRDFIAQLSTE
jgi:excinuclease ABC subunit B